MGFSFSSFLGGAATGISENIDKYEKEAQKNAEIQMNLMTKNYMSRKEELDALRNKSVEDAKFIAGLYVNEKDNPQFEDMVFAVTQNPAALNRIKEASKESWFDPSKTTLSSIYKPVAAAPTGKSAVEQVDNLLNMSNAVRSVGKYTLVDKKPSKNIFREFAVSEADSAAKKQFNTIAASLGTTPEEMAGAMNFSRPTADISGKFDYAALKAPQTWQQKKEAALLTVAAAASAVKAIENDAERFASEPIREKARQDLLYAQGELTSLLQQEQILDGPQRQLEVKIANAKLTVLSPDAPASEKKAANDFFTSLKTIGDDESKQLQNLISGLQLQMDATKDPMEKARIQERLQGIYESQNKKLKDKDLPTLDQYARNFKAAISNAITANITKVGKIQWTADGEARYAGDPEAIGEFNRVRKEAAMAFLKKSVGPDGKLIDPSYAWVIDFSGYNFPKRADGSYVLDGSSAAASAPTSSESIDINAVVQAMKSKGLDTSLSNVQKQVDSLQKDGKVVNNFDKWIENLPESVEARKQQAEYADRTDREAGLMVRPSKQSASEQALEKRQKAIQEQVDKKEVEKVKKDLKEQEAKKKAEEYKKRMGIK